MRDEIHNIRNELLSWVNCWQDSKLKKGKYKAMKRPLVSANKIMLRQEDQYKVKTVKLRARLVEAKMAAKLHIKTQHTYQHFVSISSMFCKLIGYEQVIE